MITLIGGLLLVCFTVYSVYPLLRDKLFRKFLVHSTQVQILVIMAILFFISGTFFIISSILENDFYRELLVKIAVGSLRINVGLFWLFIDALDSDRLVIMRAMLPLSIVTSSIITFSTLHYTFVKMYGFWERYILYGKLVAIDLTIASVLLIGTTATFIYKDIKLRLSKRREKVYQALLSIYDVVTLLAIMATGGLLINIVLMLHGFQLVYSVVVVVVPIVFESVWIRIHKFSPLIIYAYGLDLHGYGVLRRDDFMPIYLHLNEDGLEKCVSILFSSTRLDRGVSAINFSGRVFLVGVGHDIVFVVIINRFKDILIHFVEFVVENLERILEHRSIDVLTPRDVDLVVGDYLKIFI